jgi:hypothetical protein
MPIPIPALAIIWQGIPTSDPGTEGALWNENGFLRISAASTFTSGLLDFSGADYSQYLALLNEDF